MGTITAICRIADRVRQRYGMTERDDATGLDHTWWRKYENFAGRWTSPDPYLGSMTLANPQSFNRYAYVQNDPVNVIDPTGLDDLPNIGHVGDVTTVGSFHEALPGGNSTVWGGFLPLAIVSRQLRTGNRDGTTPGNSRETTFLIDADNDNLDDCVLNALGKWLKAETVTNIKQTLARAGLGVGVLAVMFGAPEAVAAARLAPSAWEAGLAFSVAGKDVSLFSAVVGTFSGYYWLQTVVESVGNKKEVAAALKDCLK